MDFSFRLEDEVFVLVRAIVVCSTTKGFLGRALLVLFRVEFPGRSVRLAAARTPVAGLGGGGLGGGGIASTVGGFWWGLIASLLPLRGPGLRAWREKG